MFKYKLRKEGKMIAAITSKLRCLNNMAIECISKRKFQKTPKYINTFLI